MNRTIPLALISFVLLALVGVGVYVGLVREQESSLETIKLYFYNPDLDKDAEGNILCSSQGLVPVERQVLASSAHPAEVVRQLLEGGILPEESRLGLTTEFPLQGVELLGADFADGDLILKFDDPEYKTSGGACRVSILAAQVETTAKQFPEVTSVRFEPEDIFQP